jgi:carboxyl-terminal processing protease
VNGAERRASKLQIITDRYRCAGGCLLALAFLAASAAAQAPLSPRQLGEDFDTMWRSIDEGYAYFDRNRPAWKRARESWRPKATRARDRSAFVAALEGALLELRDDNVVLSEHAADSPRRFPAEADIWARWRDGVAVVEAVRTFGDADVAGLRPGQVVVAVQGAPVERAVRDALGSTAMTAGSRDWALRHVLAGPRNGTLRIEVRDAKRPLEIERRENSTANGPPIIARRMGDERDLGYIRLKSAADGARVAEHFDAALNYLKDTRALIIDLRETSGPASRAATRAILGRFVDADTAWQHRDARGRARVTDTVAKNGASAYRAALLVLVDRWTAGEAEALAAGLAAIARARLVGTPTAGLRGEIREVKLAHSGIAVRFPAERTFLVDGTPRETLRPAVEIDLAAPSGGPGDPILYQALKLLEAR